MKNTMKIFFNKGIVIGLLVLAPYISNASISSIEIVSRNDGGDLGNGDTESFSVSSDVRYVAFSSEATNLVVGDTNDVVDVFVYDRQTDTIERVSVSSLGVQADAASNNPSISSDGRYVSFSSNATNLVAGDTNDATDVFVYDRQTDTVERVSVNDIGAEADNASGGPTISDDGRYVSFISEATNLVANDENETEDVLVYDRQTDTVERVSVDSIGTEANGSSDDVMISPNGRYVTFSSNASNLVENDLNTFSDTFLYDRQTDTMERISVSTAETEGDQDSVGGSISSDGRFVVFYSSATDLVSGDTNGFIDIFLRDRTLGTTIRVSESLSGENSNESSTDVEISADGRFIVFNSAASNLVDGDLNTFPDLFLYDRLTDNIERINTGLNDEEADAQTSGGAFVVNNGRYIGYVSGATNFVSGDNNARSDVFIAQISDDDGVSDTIENAAPGSGDGDESGYLDAIEHNITSVDNDLTEGYTTIVSEGECFNNANVQVFEETDLDTNDPEYAYPAGIIDFGIGCKTDSDSGDITVYFYGDIDSTGMTVRKFNDSTNTFMDIESATITEDTMNGETVLKVDYSVEDGGDLDEDGVANGIVIDPVGLALVSADPEPSGGGSSSGSRSKARKLAQVPSVSLTPSPACYVFTTFMKVGSKYGEVAKLQEQLNALGISSGTADGLFGPMTNSAVKTFQSSKNLVSDGIVGPLTRAMLNSCK